MTNSKVAAAITHNGPVGLVCHFQLIVLLLEGSTCTKPMQNPQLLPDAAHCHNTNTRLGRTQDNRCQRPKFDLNHGVVGLLLSPTIC